MAGQIAEQELESQTRFLSTIRHEIRTPMASIIGLIELINLSADQEEVRSLSKAALAVCKRLLQIQNDLLYDSQLQAGIVNLEYQLFAVRPVIGDIVQLASAEANRKHIKIASVVHSRVPEFLCGDELRVRQILQNFVLNAIKFTPEKGCVDISVEITRQTKNSVNVKFSVTDTGIGISDEQKNQTV